MQLKKFVIYVARLKPANQDNSLVEQWLSVPGDHGSNPDKGEIFSKLFLSSNLMIPI